MECIMKQFPFSFINNKRKEIIISFPFFPKEELIKQMAIAIIEIIKNKGEPDNDYVTIK